MKRLFFFVLATSLGIFGAQGGHTEEKTVFFLTIRSTINPGTANFVEEGVAEAKARGGEALVIELDTPGGLLDSTRDIVQTLLNSDFPIVVFVTPRGGRAGSAGVFITLAAHVAVMAPGTNIGAAHPVSGTGQDPEEGGGKQLAKKIENDTAAFIESIANQRHRNVGWARSAVLESISITEVKALEEKVIDLVAEDRPDLLQKIDGRKVHLTHHEATLATRGAKMVDLEMSFKQEFLNHLSNPNVIFFLIIIAMLGIYMELSHPGAIAPGVAAALAIILILLTSQSLPFNAGGVLLLILGAVFFILEVYVTSYGMLAVGGILCFVLGSVFLFDLNKNFGFLGIAKHLVALAAVMLGGFVGVTAYLIARSRRVTVLGGAEGMIGQVGAVVEYAGSEGKVFIAGEYWRFGTKRADVALHKGDRVRVVAANNLMLTVEPEDRERA